MLQTIDNTQIKDTYNLICQSIIDEDSSAVQKTLQNLSAFEVQELFSYLENEDNLLLFVYKNLTKDKSIINTLVDYNQFLYLEDEKSNNILWLAAKDKDYALLRYCLGKAPQLVNYVNLNGESLVDLALLSFDLELLKVIFHFNPKVNIFNKFIISKDSLLCVGTDIKIKDKKQQQFIQAIYDHLVGGIHKEALEAGIKKMGKA